MVRNKCIILPFLLLAWAVIFAHGVVPHHHHSEKQSIKNHCHDDIHDAHINYDALNAESEFSCCDHNRAEYTCHFHVEILTQVSIDNVFISHTENSLFSDITSFEKKLVSYYQVFIPDQIPQKYYLRGPPQLHNS